MENKTTKPTHASLDLMNNIHGTKPCKVTFLTNPLKNINPKTSKLQKPTNLGDEKRGLPLESDSLQLSSKLQSLKWSEMVKNGKFVKVGNESNGVYVKERKNEMVW